MNHAWVLFAQLLLRDPAVPASALHEALLEIAAAEELGIERSFEDALEGKLAPEVVERTKRALARAHHLEAESAFVKLLVKEGLATREQLRAIIAGARDSAFEQWLAPLLVRTGLVGEERLVWFFERRRLALFEQRAARVRAFRELLASLGPECDEERLRAALAYEEPDELVPVPPLDPVHALSRGPQPLLKVKDSLVHGYEISRRLDKGGMGVVYKARHLATGRVVALKILPLAVVPESRGERFRWECLATIRLRHEHLVRAFDFGACEDYYYLALELLEGECLSARLKTQRIPDREALSLVRQLALALEELSRQGIVHRDVKPSNVFVHEGHVKLYDLGLCKLLGRWEDVRSMDRGGTPQYLSPEQALERESVDLRSDLYALGITLFHLVTAKLPFTNAPIEEIMRRHVEDEVPDPRTFDPFVGDSTAAIVAKLTRKSREQRYQSVPELLRDIERVLAVEPAIV